MSKPAFMKIWLWPILVLVAVVLVFAAVTFAQRSKGQPLPADAEALLRRAVRIAPGLHVVGSREAGCYPVREVALPGFYVWPVETPQSWWDAFRGDADRGRDGKLPVTGVSYHEAVAFCEWFSAKYGVRARLPTVDEWEVAARAGTPGMPYHWGWGKPSGRSVMNAAAPSPVSHGRPNALGLWNMCGNVSEWCAAEGDAAIAPVMGGSWAERDQIGRAHV